MASQSPVLMRKKSKFDARASLDTTNTANLFSNDAEVAAEAQTEIDKILAGMAKVQEQLKYMLHFSIFFRLMFHRFLPDLRLRALREVGQNTHHIQAVEVSLHCVLRMRSRVKSMRHELNTWPY
jgi:hypothetical protein